MKKLLIFFLAFCMMAGSVTVHAENFNHQDSISLEENRTIRIPEPDGEIDPDAPYFTYVLTFVPEKDGYYCFRVVDPEGVYEYTTEVVGGEGYFPIEGGCAFEGTAGEVYELRFQYPNHDGRYPEFNLIVLPEYNHSLRETIPLNETRTITIPAPKYELVENWVYYTHAFYFTPKEDGTYRFLVRYEEPETDPYEIYMDVEGEYRELSNGCAFEGQAGETYELSFQYFTHDGRYPEFTFYVTSNDVQEVPKTGDPGLLLPALAFLLSGAGLILLLTQQKKHA